jgi:hypothetical protein
MTVGWGQYVRGRLAERTAVMPDLRNPTPGDVSAWTPHMSGCNRAVGRHVSWVHNINEDRCLCGQEARPCLGACELPDFGWLGVRCESTWDQGHVY